VPQVDLIDETFLLAGPAVLSPVIHDERRWRQWWPDLRLTVSEDRAERGIRWLVDGPFVGTMEVWLEPVGDGSVAHYYLRVDPADGRVLSVRESTKEAERRARRAKQVFWSVRDEVESGRAAGEP
jgi:hypothetical protein